MTAAESLDRFFRITERGSTIRREVRAGAVVFLAMAYVLVVMPATLSDGTGMDSERVFSATALAAIVATLIMALYARYPIALAPAMGTNAFFTYTIIGNMGYSWQEALGAVFVSGVLFMLISVSGLRERIISALPKELRISVTAGIGAFLLLVGLNGSGIIVSDPSTLVTLGDLSDKAVVIALFGIALTVVLYVRKITGAIFIGIVVTAAIAMIFGVTPVPDAVVSVPEMPYAGDFWDGLLSVHWDITFVIVILSFLMVDFFDTTGTVMAVAKGAGAMDDDGDIRDGRKVFLSDGAGTAIGAAIGVSSVTCYAESTVGISAGARTGLAALTVACLFAVSLLFGPVFSVIDSTATVSAMFIVAAIMLSSLRDLDWGDMPSVMTAVATIGAMVFGYSITDGLGFGVIVYCICKAATGDWRKIHPLIYALAAVFVLYFLAHALTF